MCPSRGSCHQPRIDPQLFTDDEQVERTDDAEAEDRRRGHAIGDPCHARGLLPRRGRSSLLEDFRPEAAFLFAHSGQLLACDARRPIDHRAIGAHTDGPQPDRNQSGSAPPLTAGGSRTRVSRRGSFLSRLCPIVRPQMIHPPDPMIRAPFAVRDGRGAPVTCEGCGCRLQAVGHPGAEAWFHFNPLGGRDARGCRVGCADAAHDAAGRPALALA